MKHKEKLSELAARIREALPRLKEIQRGYRFWYTPEGDTDEPFVYEVVNVYKGGQIDSTVGRYCTTTNEWNTMQDFWRYEDVESMEVIGCEPTLNDALEWLGKTLRLEKYSREIALTHLGDLVVLDYGVENFILLKNPTIDLTKPFLKDQSEELIDYLLNLKQEQ